jgi:hypothetical protein
MLGSSRINKEVSVVGLESGRGESKEIRPESQ